MKKIYLAGPEVFRKDAIKTGKKLVKKCKKYGFKGLYPLDNVIKASSKKELSREIFLANRKMIEKADFVIANINPFRGYEPDSGTVWEIGYALGLGKKVFGYIDLPETDYIDRIDSNDKYHLEGEFEGFFEDLNSMLIEDLGNPVNLMIAESITICDSFKSCLKQLKNI
jgi:nucleoside 2-deoxyribosyltransferase